MFVDEEPEELTTAEERYRERLKRFARDGLPHPRLRHHAHWLFHNCVVHPLLGAMPNDRMAELHRLSSGWLNESHVVIWSPVEPPRIDPSKRAWWVLHNVVAHGAIGLLPTRATFRFHDWTAEKMAVSGWV